METRVFADEQAAAEAAAAITAAAARAAVAERGRFVLALSRGRTPWIMLPALAAEDVPWSAVHKVQVDERVAPAADPDRNLRHIRETLIDQAPVRPENLHPMLGSRA